MKEKKSCSNCKYIHCFSENGEEKRHCTNQTYLANKFKSKCGRSQHYCTWYEPIK